MFDVLAGFCPVGLLEFVNVNPWAAAIPEFSSIVLPKLFGP